jgi:hypothetical protein
MNTRNALHAQSLAVGVLVGCEYLLFLPLLLWWLNVVQEVRPYVPIAYTVSESLL